MAKELALNELPTTWDAHNRLGFSYAPEFYPPVLAGKLSKESVLDTLVFAGLMVTGILAQLSSRESFRFIRDFIKDFPSEKQDFRVRQGLQLQAYGHEDVLDLFRGIKSKEPTEQSPNGRKTCLMGLGGAKACNSSAGVFLGMNDRGVYKRADGLILDSAATCNGLGGEAEQGEDLVGIYQNELCEPGRFVLARNAREVLSILFKKIIYGPQAALVDTDLVAQLMRTTHLLDTEKVRRSPRELIAVLMNVSNGQPEYHDLRSAPDILKVMEAAIRLPLFARSPSVKLENGEYYADGGYADPIPLKFAFDKGYTDVLIVSPTPLFKNQGFLQTTLIPLVLAALASHIDYGYSAGVLNRIKNLEHKNQEQAEYVESVIIKNDPNQRVAVIEPFDLDLCQPLETNSRFLVQACNDARRFANELFASSRYIYPPTQTRGN